MFNCLIMHMCHLLLFSHEGKQKFLQTVLVQKEETVTLLRETEIFNFVLHCCFQND